MSLIDLASLVLAPTATKEGKVYSAIPDTGDGDMTFTRGSSATRVNSAGLIEKERANLLLQSNTFDTTWTTNNTSVTGGQLGYDGSSDAWLLTKSASSARVEQSITQSGVQTYSVYAKAGTLDFVVLNNGVVFQWYDLSNGTIGTNSSSANTIDAEIEDVGNGWYRCSLIFNSSTTIVRIYPSQADSDASGSSGSIYIQDAMLNQGLVAQSYIETTTSAVYEGITDDVPRVDYSGGGCPSLLLEPSRTNAFTSSEYFDNWILQTNVNLTHNAIESPEGLINGVKYNISSNSQRAIDQNVTLSNGNTYTFSLYVKAIVDTTIRVRDNIGGWSENIDVFAADGWQRITSTKTITSSSTQLGFFDNSGDSGDRFYFYGAMLEEGSYASSYIPTYGVSSTRVADSCSKTGISELIGQSEGTLFCEVNFSKLTGTTPREWFIISDANTSATSDWLTISTSGAGTNLLRARISEGGVIKYDKQYTLPTIGVYKMALAYKSGDCELYVNGSAVGTVVTNSAFTLSMDRIISSFSSGTFELGDGLKQAILFPIRLTNDQLEELTK